MQAHHWFLRSPWVKIVSFAMVLQAAACDEDGDSAAGSSEAKGAEASGSAEAKANVQAEAPAAVTIQPKLGGSVLAVGEAQVEVAVFENGAVKGLVFDAQGKPISDRAAVDFAVTLQAASGATPKVDLDWNDACACFAGQAELEGALAVRPIDVALSVSGDSDVAKLESYALLPAPKVTAEAGAAVSARAAVPPTPKVDTKLVAGSSAKGSADLRAPSVDLKAGSGGANASAKASASVSVPKPTVQLKAGQSTSTATTKDKAGAGVKAGASFSFGTK